MVPFDSFLTDPFLRGCNREDIHTKHQYPQLPLPPLKLRIQPFYALWNCGEKLAHSHPTEAINAGIVSGTLIDDIRMLHRAWCDPLFDPSENQEFLETVHETRRLWRLSERELELVVRGNVRTVYKRRRSTSSDSPPSRRLQAQAEGGAEDASGGQFHDRQRLGW